MPGSDGDEFGGIDDEDLLAIVKHSESYSGVLPNLEFQALEHRTRKRRRLNNLSAGPESIENESGRGIPHWSRAERQEEEDEGESGSRSPSTPSHISSQGESIDSNGRTDTPATPEPKPKSRHKIHIPKQVPVHQEQFYTQVPQSSQSPYRMRGAYWQKPKNTDSLRRSLDNAGTGMGGALATSSEDSQLARLDHASIDSTLSRPPLVETFTDSTSSDEPANLDQDTVSSIKCHCISVNSPIDICTQTQFQSALGAEGRQVHSSIGSKTNLHQTTLFRGQSQAGFSKSQPSTGRRNWPLTNKDEEPTHHKIDRDAMMTWVYPINLGAARDYQFNIVRRGLFHNLLIALPTGLGKTFIAATIMLNWYRWTQDAQIVFVAPTKPLVAQQVAACFNIAGIPKSATTMLTGNTAPGIRAEEWTNKRVFFMTPQTIINDLKAGICDPKRVVLLVVDEAHRATGSYAYVEVVKYLKRFTNSFRVVALTATPGASVEAVQEVIDGLGVSKVEIRTEESLDIRQYVHSRKIDPLIFEYSEEMVMIMDLFSEAVRPVLNRLNGMNAYWSKDPLSLTPFGCTQARQKWMASQGQRSDFATKGMVNTIFTILASLSHSLELLKFHGIVPFFHKVCEFRNEAEGDKGGKYRRQILDSGSFKTMMARVQSWVSNVEFIGHPKLEYLQSVVLNHFLDASEGSISSTKIMVFVHFRDSAEEVVRILKRNEPMVRPHVFVGQASSKNSAGMDQKKQLDIIQKFKSGTYNTLVATSIGEEGLDIGEVDLIVCYDASASPIRMLQRMGRTGRKRAGNIKVLLMKKREEGNFTQAKDNYEKMQKMIAAGDRFTFQDAPRIVPKDIQPNPDMKMIDIPLENTQGDLPEPKKRARVPKRPPKKYHMPDGVRKGFRKASRLEDDDESGSEDSSLSKERPSRRPPTPVSIPNLDSVLLTTPQGKELEVTYLDIGGDTPAFVEAPRIGVFPNLQRVLRPSKHLRHGKATERFVDMLERMHGNAETVDRRLLQNLHLDDRDAGEAQVRLRTSFWERPKASRVSREILSSASTTPMIVRSPNSIKTSSRNPQHVDYISSTDEEVADEHMMDFIDDDLILKQPNMSFDSSPPQTDLSGLIDDLSDSTENILKISKKYSRASTELPINVPGSSVRKIRRRGSQKVVESDSDD